MAQAAPIIGALVSAYGAYQSGKAAKGAAAAGPVFPADAQQPRTDLGNLFSSLLESGGSYRTVGSQDQIDAVQKQIDAYASGKYGSVAVPRSLMTQLAALRQVKFVPGTGGFAYPSAPFDITLNEGSNPYAAVDKYRAESQPLFQADLSRSLDAAKAKLGGQFGIRFGTDLATSLGDTTQRAIASREANLGALGVSAYDTYQQRRLADIQTRLNDYNYRQLGYLPLIASYLNGQPTSQPYLGSPTGTALQTGGALLSNYPLYQYLSSLGGNAAGTRYTGPYVGGQPTVGYGDAISLYQTN